MAGSDAETLREEAMTIEFNGSGGFTLGVEEELLLVDASTGELTPKIDEVMARLPEDLTAYVSYELFQSVLEIKTPVCATVAETRGKLADLRDRVASWTAACGASLATAGTHPFSRYREQKVTRQERYRYVLETLRWIAKREVIFGQHIHVSVPDQTAAIEAHNRLAESVPLILALSANSPFWQGIDTGFESTRVKIFETFPRSGLPPAFPDYAAFESYVEMMVRAGAMEDYTYCWWDVRPHPKIGTIEMRVPDAQTRLDYAAALTALTQCLVARAIEDTPEGPYNRDLTAENKWRASRHGLNASLYVPEEDRSIPTKELARTLVAELRPFSQGLGCEEELSGVLEIVEKGTGSQHQRRAYERRNNFADVVSFLIEKTRPVMAGEQS